MKYTNSIAYLKALFSKNALEQLTGKRSRTLTILCGEIKNRATEQLYCVHTVAPPRNIKPEYTRLSGILQIKRQTGERYLLFRF